MRARIVQVLDNDSLRLVVTRQGLAGLSRASARRFVVLGMRWRRVRRMGQMARRVSLSAIAEGERHNQGLLPPINRGDLEAVEQVAAVKVRCAYTQVKAPTLLLLCTQMA